MLRLRLGDELGAVRRADGISLRAIARMLGVSANRLARAERGDPTTLTIDLAARYAAALGLTLAASFHPDGDAIRDRGQLALLERFRRRVPPGARWRTEVPIPIAGDQRSGDAVVSIRACVILVEAETHLGDFQAVERRIGRRRETWARTERCCCSRTPATTGRWSRRTPAIPERFPVGMRTWFRTVGGGQDPGGDALVIL